MNIEGVVLIYLQDETTIGKIKGIIENEFERELEIRRMEVETIEQRIIEAEKLLETLNTYSSFRILSFLYVQVHCIP